MIELQNILYVRCIDITEIQCTKIYLQFHIIYMYIIFIKN